MEAVHEIGMVAGFDPRQHRVGMVDHQIVPAHMRHFQPRFTRHNAHHLAADPAKTGVGSNSRPRVASICMPMQIPRKGTARRVTASSIASNRPVKRCSAAFAGGKGAVARQHDAVGAGHHIGLAGDHHRASPGLAGHALEAFCAECRLPGRNRPEPSGSFRAPLWWRAAPRPCGDRVQPPCAAHAPPI